MKLHRIAPLGVCLLLAFALTAAAQDFEVEPDSLEGTGWVDSLAIFNSRFENLWDEVNTITWEKVEDLPEGWSTEFCQVSYLCWPPWIYTATMDFDPGQEDTLEVKFYPTSEGVGSMTLILTPEADTSMRQEFTFTLRAQSLAAPRDRGVGEPILAWEGTGFRLPRAAVVRVVLFDLLGRQAATVWNGPAPAGRSLVPLSNRAGLPGGVYLVRLEASGYPPQFGKLVLFR